MALMMAVMLAVFLTMPGHMGAAGMQGSSEQAPVAAEPAPGTAPAQR